MKGLREVRYALAAAEGTQEDEDEEMEEDGGGVGGGRLQSAREDLGGRRASAPTPRSAGDAVPI